MLAIENIWVFNGSVSIRGTKEYLWLMTFGEYTPTLFTTDMDTFKMDTFCGTLVVLYNKRCFYHN